MKKIYADANNNMVINSSKDILISPDNGNGTGSKILIPVNTPLAFSVIFNAQSLIQMKTAYENTLGYMIGRGTVTGNSGRLFTFNIPSYSDYSSSGARPRFSIIC